MAAKRVLVYTPSVNRGGMHLVVETLLDAFARYAPKREWKFGVLGQQYDEIHQRIHYPDGWSFTQIDPYDKLPPYDFGLLATLGDTFNAHLRRVVAEGKYDLVYCPVPWWCMNTETWALDVPIVIGVADFAFDHMEMGPIAHRFRDAARKMAERASLSIFSSEFQRQHGEATYGFTPTRCIPYSAGFVTPGFDPSPEAAARARMTYGLPERYVLAFHSFGHKGVSTIIQAQFHARQRSAHVPPLVIAGIETEHYLNPKSKDPHIVGVRNLLQRLRVAFGRDTFILGNIPDRDIAGLHAGATVAVQASRSEGDISGASNAAIMAGTPLIHSDLPAYARLNDGEQRSLTFPVDDHAALGDAVIETCENTQTATQRALRASEWAQQRTVKDVALDYLDAFKSVL